MGRIFEGIPIRFWLAIILFSVLVLAGFSLYQRFALPPKVTISQANFAGVVTFKTNKGEPHVWDGFIDRGIITQTTSINLLNGDHDITVTQGEKVLERVTRHVDKEPVKKVEAFQENLWSLQIEISINDQVAAVFVNGQTAKSKDGVSSIGFPLWTIQMWEDETLNLRIEDREGNGGVYPPIPLSTYLPTDRIELRDQNNRLWGLAFQNKPFWWDFLSTFKVQTYIGKELVSNNVITWEQTALLVIAVAIPLVGIMFIIWWLIGIARRIELTDG